MSGSTPITIDPDLAALLMEAAERGEPLTVKIDDHDYELSITPSERPAARKDLWEGYDPEAIRRALANVAGIFTEEEGEALIRQIREAREAGTRPSSRP